MKDKRMINKILFSTLLLAVVLSSCTTPGLSGATPTPYIIVITNTPTVDMAPFMTQAAETVFAQLTETALAMPTETPVPPTDTPTITQTFTSTATLIPAASSTPVKTSTPVKSNTPKATATKAGWNCEITFQLVENGKEFNTNEDFDARWTIKNTGTETWSASDVDYIYVSGTEMQKFNKLYDLPASVSPGNSITIIVDMKAPGSSGYYETFWALARHSDGFCSLPTRIKVK
jgi:hypothetical protein